MREGWKTVKLGDVCALDKTKYRGKNLPFVGLEDIESGSGRFIGNRDPQHVGSATFRFTDKHVLYGRLRPYLNKVLLPDFEGHCSSEIFPIMPSNRIDKRFLYYWITRVPIVDAINRTCTGARMPRANVNEILTFDFPLPPLPEQKRIVAILDEAFEGIKRAIANAEKNLANARELFESYLNAVFTQKGEEWEKKTFDAIAKIKGGKRVPKGYKLQVEPTGYPYISVSDLNDMGSVDISAIKYISYEVHTQIKRYIISCDDIYISIAGTIGKTGIIPECLDGANLTENACKLVFNKDVLNKFVYYFTITKSFKEQALKNTRIAAQPKLALARLKTIELGIPPLEVQKRIVSEFDNLWKQTQHLEIIYQQKLTALTELKQSLLQKAFTGELTAKPETALKQEAVA